MRPHDGWWSRIICSYICPHPNGFVHESSFRLLYASVCVCVCVFVVSTILQPCSHASALKTYRHQENCATAMLCQSREVQPVLVICYYTHNHVRVFYRLSVTAFERINSMKAILDKMEKCVIAAG